jgi:hypothetical protein
VSTFPGLVSTVCREPLGAFLILARSLIFDAVGYAKAEAIMTKKMTAATPSIVGNCSPATTVEPTQKPPRQLQHGGDRSAAWAPRRLRRDVTGSAHHDGYAPLGIKRRHPAADNREVETIAYCASPRWEP